MSECIHGLDDAWCAVCTHGPVRADPVSIVATFYARYEGDCGGCDLPIAVGQVVHRLSNDRYVHEAVRVTTLPPLDQSGLPEGMDGRREVRPWWRGKRAV